ncbi:MAG: hypothetical protein OXK80_05210 [Bdellovibrionales bacterium]|nr:hypothetical protein [Bdellovibrionales bacterium]
MDFFDIFSKFFDHMGIAGISLLFLLTVYILYKAYKAELPSLDADLSIINKDTYKEILEKKSPNQTAVKLDHDLYLVVYIVNTGKRIICPTQICNDKGKKVINILTETGFEYVLKKGEEYSNIHPLDENSIKVIKESKHLYILDFAKRKFPVLKEYLRTMRSELNQHKK